MKHQSKFYKHYKNKPYRFIGIAKDSEELKDYVVYECLYPNELAKLWIRPKDMFFEVGDFQGSIRPRFTQIPSEIKNFTILTDEVLATLIQICKSTILDFNEEIFLARFKNQKNMTVFCYYFEQELAGFRIGYELDETRYYSWLGVVLKNYQQLGVERALMQEQQDWAKTQNYQIILFEKKL